MKMNIMPEFILIWGEIQFMILCECRSIELEAKVNRYLVEIVLKK